ncbi:MAG: sulfurtransferase [Bacteroidetes bacterium]|nr:sulfurtransferase [Rhodothermia bacterium]MCS7155505.1 sulfurtransferase [Bacteroidota bacterium]MCX7907402.1 sulfurtransferase [Bacteroidota bacterium]MDW8138396.1 sulfurtransferase [Bacteroidota bacterium]MDW8284667.1 sulfurtransferase [Bacteroidota bacterium]
MKPYAHPESLVSTEWVAAHMHDTARIRIVESNEDILLYDTGHIPNAVHLDWTRDLQDPIMRDYIDKERFAALCSRLGIGNDTTVVFYGDKNNWWACYAFWVFKLFGHKDCRIMDGGRQKWIAEGRPLVREVPSFAPRPYVAQDPDLSIRAFRDQVLAHMRAGKPLVDVRTPQEYAGELTHMPDYPQEGALRAGHIPGAVNVPWSRAVREDGTFRSREELERLYLQEQGLSPQEEVITYCRIGERSSHTWFVLRYLLGFERVRNYDGSWTEWGNLVGVPIEKGPGRQSS